MYVFQILSFFMKCYLCHQHVFILFYVIFFNLMLFHNILYNCMLFHTFLKCITWNYKQCLNSYFYDEFGYLWCVCFVIIIFGVWSFVFYVASRVVFHYLHNDWPPPSASTIQFVMLFYPARYAISLINLSGKGRGRGQPCWGRGRVGWHIVI